MSWPNKLFKQLVNLKNFNLLQLLRQETGVILIFTAIAIPTLLGMVGLAYDVGNLYMHKARLQNVADSAALAGARAYVNSQENTESPKDDIDTSTNRKNEETYNVGGPTKTRTLPHPNADTAADNYIYKNIINLGNTVYTDPYSHFALLSDEDNPKTFYRVGLYEYVDLRFLPIIRGISKKQRVAVESIVVLEEDTGSAVPSTIFGNLYTYSGYLNVQQGTITNPDPGALSKKPSEGGATIQMTFDGEMVYTGNTTSGFWGTQDSVEHLYTSDGKTAQIEQNLSANEMGSNYTNDPKPSKTPITLSDYQDILNSKLSKPHIKLNMSNNTDYNNFTVDNINDLTSSLYNQQETDKDGNGLYTLTVNAHWGPKEYTYAIDPTYQNDHNNIYRYYAYDSNNKKMYFIPNNFGSRVPAYIGASNSSFYDNIENWIQYNGDYVLDSNDKKIYYTIVNDDVYFANEDHQRIKKYNRNETHCYYLDDNGSEVLINYIAIDNNTLLNNNNKRMLQINTNVFRLTGSTNKKITIDKAITGGGDTSEPIYIINDTNQELQIEVSAGVNQVRPIVFIHNGTNAVRLTVNNGAVFNSVIYAPNVTGGGEDGVTVKLYGSSFLGNIVAQNISVSNVGQASFTKKNHLETDTELYNAIVSYANEHGHLGDSSSDSNKPPSNTYNGVWQQWYTTVGSEIATQWFNKLTRSQQVAFWRSWDSIKRPKNSDSGIRNKWYSTDWKKSEYGWPFPDWEPTPQEIQDAKDDKPVDSIFETKLRLINPRLELNPFTNIAS